MNPGPLKQFDREEVLTRAMEVFWEQGFESASMADLLEHMAIGRQSLYDTFGDKRTLFLEALRLYLDTMLGPMLDTLSAPRPAADNLQAAFAMWREHAADEGCRGCLAANTSAEFGADDPEVRELVGAGLQRFEDQLAETLARAQDEGAIDAGLDTRDLARTFVTLCQGMAVLSRSGSGSLYTDTAIETMARLIGLGR